MSDKTKNEKTKISVDELLDKYNLLTNEELKNNMIKSVVKRKYVPVLEKKLILKTMLDHSIQTDVTGVRYVDMFLSEINFVMAVLILYTNIEIKKGTDNSDNMFVDYDKLVENNILNLILDEIGDAEIKRLLTVNDQLMNTFYNQEKSTEAYMHKLVTQFSTIFGTLCNNGLEQINDIIKDEKKMNKIVSMIDKASKSTKK